MDVSLMDGFQNVLATLQKQFGCDCALAFKADGRWYLLWDKWGYSDIRLGDTIGDAYLEMQDIAKDNEEE